MKIPRFSPWFVGLLWSLPVVAAPEKSAPPWESARPLRELAREAVVTARLQAADAQPDVDAYPAGSALPICSLKMRTTLWGTPDRLTLSLMKNNVWDRRINPAPAPTLAEITAGAFSPANREWKNPKEAFSARPASLGYLRVEGGAFDPYRTPVRYAFPCPKPVGQVILGMEDFRGAAEPELRQGCADGVVDLTLSKGAARARVEYALGMTSNLYAIRGEVAGLRHPVTLRLYRHADTAHLAYLSADGKTYTVPGAEAGRAWNGPIDPPTSGAAGRDFWIRQRLPAEKTFPAGFEYVLVARVLAPGKVRVTCVEGERGLGTRPKDAEVAAAPGAAATAEFVPGEDGRFEVLVTVVTTMDGADLLAEARRRLDAAEGAGFAGVQRENADWWAAFYDRREAGRVFGAAGAATWPGEGMPDLFRSWYCVHGGGTKPDMRRLEASAHYAAPEVDRQPWHGLPCYNEIFYTSRYVHNWADSVDMWKQTVAHWQKAAERNARERFDLPGMCLTHGYQPPITPDRYVSSAIALELCLATMAQVVRPLWDEWDYGGDVAFLRDEAYPPMRAMAEFFAAYVKRGDDGHYHAIPSMLEEDWGIYPEFRRNRDAISTLSMMRWAFRRTAEAAETLGVDAAERGRWREIARDLAPNPVWETPEGPVLGGLPGIEPVRFKDSHPWDPALYPVVAADEIHLDSPAAERAMAARTARMRPNASTDEALRLLGETKVGNDGAEGRPRAGETAEALLNDRSGRIHLFPGVAAGEEVAFRRFQARGGFLVSASRGRDGVEVVEIEARREGTCRVANPWPGRSVTVRDADTGAAVPREADAGDTVAFAAQAGHRYRLER